MTAHRRRHRHRRRHPRLLDRAASGAARPEAGADREGLCRPPCLGRQCRRRAPARARTSPRSRCRSPRWRCGSGSTIWSTTIAASRATAGAGGRERGGARRASAPASTICRLHGFTPRGADRRGRAAAAGAGGVGALPRRRGLAARRRGRSVPHHAGLPAQGASSSARRCIEGVTRHRLAAQRRRLAGRDQRRRRSRRRRSSTPPAPGPTASRPMLGEPVPLEVIAPMLMVTRRVPAFIEPVVILRGRKLSFKQFANGTVVIGGGHLAHALSRPQRDGARLGEARDQRRARCGSCSR